jgi:chemotaxis protein methyltransferase CheR
MAETGDNIELLGQDDFARVAYFIENTTGIKIPPGKKTMVEGRLRRRARALGLGSMAEYCRHVFEKGGFDEESTHLIDAVTTNKTDFFREPSHFTFLAETVLPEALGLGSGIDRPFKIWSNPSSIGAEPFTIAMVLAEFARTHPGWRYQVFASDISTKVLKHAQRAVFTEDEIDPVPMELRKRYLLRSKDRSRGQVRIVPELRRMVTFFRLNVIESDYGVEGDFDAIFCRNLLIYFDTATQEQVVRRLVTHLRPGGYLFLGHTESMANKSVPLHWLGDAVFQRKDDEADPRPRRR